MSKCSGSCKIHVARITGLSFIFVNDVEEPGFTAAEIKEAILWRLGEYGWHDPKCTSGCFCQAKKNQRPKSRVENLKLERITINLGGKRYDVTVTCKRTIKTYDGDCID